MKIVYVLMWIVYSIFLPLSLEANVCGAEGHLTPLCSELKQGWEGGECSKNNGKGCRGIQEGIHLVLRETVTNVPGQCSWFNVKGFRYQYSSTGERLSYCLGIKTGLTQNDCNIEAHMKWTEHEDTHGSINIKAKKICRAVKSALQGKNCNFPEYSTTINHPYFPFVRHPGPSSTTYPDYETEGICEMLKEANIQRKNLKHVIVRQMLREIALQNGSTKQNSRLKITDSDEEIVKTLEQDLDLSSELPNEIWREIIVSVSSEDLGSIPLISRRFSGLMRGENFKRVLVTHVAPDWIRRLLVDMPPDKKIKSRYLRDYPYVKKEDALH